MKRILLLLSLIVPICFSSATIVKSEALDEVVDESIICDNQQQSTVRIVNKNEMFKGNGFVYKTDDKYNYIITSSGIAEGFNNYKVVYENGHSEIADLLGYDSYNQIAVLKANKKEGITPVCLANTNHIYKGQLVFGYGYYGYDNSFIAKGILNQIGQIYTKEGNINTYRDVVQIKNDGTVNGVAIFDEIGRLVGMITGYHDKLEGSSYMIETNKLIKVSDSIIKDGKYRVNYIKYSLEDYSSLKSVLKKSYGVSDVVNSGVVITTFKPLKYVFGGLNQGMVIVSVNGVKISNMYELDKQLTRYDKNDNVCLKVIKKNGKTGFYYVKV